ncbi:MAG: RNA polymerase sigma factor [Phycisphaerae bacterium]
MAAQVSTHITLLQRLQAGDDSRAWDDFSQRYSLLIRAVASRHGLQPADADDILQDVLLALTKSLVTFVYDPQRARFRTYLQVIVQRSIFRKFRQNQTTRSITELAQGESDKDYCDGIWESEWRQYHMHLAMKSIEVEFNERDRNAFSMYFGAQMPAAMTADTLGMSLDQVYQAKSRIIRRIGELIAQQVSEEG